MEHYENFKEELQIRTAHAEEIIRRYLPEEAGFARTMAEAMNYSMCAGRQAPETDPSSGNIPDVWRG